MSFGQTVFIYFLLDAESGDHLVDRKSESREAQTMCVWRKASTEIADKLLRITWLNRDSDEPHPRF